MAIDLVCGMEVEETSPHHFEHQGTRYFFCYDGCLKEFKKNPAKYLDPNRKKPGDEAECSDLDSFYICPMDPEIRQKGPGSCPKCGMALEPEAISLEALEEGFGEEYRLMSSRFWFSAALSLPLMIGAMGGHFFDSQALKFLDAPWVQASLASPVVLWGGWPFFQRFYDSIRFRALNMFTLIGLGSGFAFLYSVVALVAPQIFPASFLDHHGNPALYFEPAAVIITLVLLGQVLELRARSKTTGAIKGLLELVPPVAHKLSALDFDATSLEVAVADLKVGDWVRVRDGERIASDGIVRSGTAEINESHLTGESLPRVVKVGSRVFGGTLNLSANLIIEIEKIGQDTLVSRMIKLIVEASRSKAPMQRLADQVSQWFVPIVVFASVVTFVVWSVWGPEPRFSIALLNAVAVLIVACPCALGLATPLSIMVGTGRAAQRGILIKSGEALETLCRVNRLFVDKTGTLTEGKPVLTRVEVSDGFILEEVLGVASALERGSAHPIAQAILNGARERKANFYPAKEVNSEVGRGLSGKVGSVEYRIGTAQFLGFESTELPKDCEGWALSGETLLFLGKKIEGARYQLAGVFGVKDALKSNVKDWVSECLKLGVQLTILSGDRKETVSSLARELGISEAFGEVTSVEKQNYVKAAIDKGEVVAFVGDGINDGPAIAQANVGIAMGTGSDVAIEAADVTLLGGDLHGFIRARELSEAVLKNIKQNLWFAFLYNALGVPIAAGVLYPVFGILLSPMIASAAMSLSSVSVITNALRLRKI